MSESNKKKKRMILAPPDEDGWMHKNKKAELYPYRKVDELMQGSFMQAGLRRRARQTSKSSSSTMTYKKIENPYVTPNKHKTNDNMDTVKSTCEKKISSNQSQESNSQNIQKANLKSETETSTCEKNKSTKLLKLESFEDIKKSHKVFFRMTLEVAKISNFL
jgi:hypothetical protein